VISHVLARAEAYGLIERHPGPQDPKRWRREIISLSPAARFVLGRNRPLTAGRAVLSFDAELVNAPGVGATVAVAAHEHVTALHDAIGLAFGWADDHLYSFWLDGEFWGDKNSELVRPGIPDTEPESRTADVPVGDLRLSVGARLAYVFDYGDEWRVSLTLRDVLPGGEPVLRVADKRGTAPPQYSEEPWPES
jgi:hypothetical protein